MSMILGKIFQSDAKITTTTASYLDQIVKTNIMIHLNTIPKQLSDSAVL
jgi:hypothetical protein